MSSRQFDQHGIALCSSPDAAVDLSKVLRVAGIKSTVLGRVLVLDFPNPGDVNVANVLWEAQS